MPIFQLTGLSGAGKTTVASKVVSCLVSKGVDATLIDGDVYRKTICKDLGFSKKDRLENIRRLGLIANEFSLVGKTVIIAAINPYESARNELKIKYSAKTVWINCDLTILRNRDTKELYKKADLPDGHPDKIQFLTGVSDTFEKPANADLVIDTGILSIDQSVAILYNYIIGII
jgi:adenylylsulfate kinase